MVLCNNYIYEYRKVFVAILQKVLIPFMLLVGFLGNTVAADCHFIRLNSYSMTQGQDVFSWGELSPMIGLKVGQFYHLTPSGMISTKYGKVNKDYQGELYYIPQSLIDTNDMFTLRMIVVERDEDSKDDLVLPYRERSISLAPELFNASTRRVEVFFQPFNEDGINPRNEQSYKFDILKNSEDCSLVTVNGRTNDSRYRLQNQLKHIRLHIKFYKRAFLDGGREYKCYRSPDIERQNLQQALDLAHIYASVNSNELISLGSKLKKLQGTENFSTVWNEYEWLVQSLYNDEIIVRYTEDKKWKEIKVPSLSFHLKWGDKNVTAGMTLPKKWKIRFPK